MAAIENALNELSKVIEKSRLQRALRSNVSGSSATNLKIGSEVLLFREKSNRWERPYKVLDLSGKSSVST